MVLEYIVADLSLYKTVRQVLKIKFNMSNRLISKLKLNKCILLNNKETYLDRLLSIGDIVLCNLDFEECSDNIVPCKIDFDIIYEDDSLLVINKKPNIAVHPSILHYDNSLANGVKYYFNSIGLNKKIRPVNRLDKDTSGLVVFAKNEYIQECLIKQMQKNSFYKEYVALLCGNLENNCGKIEAPISRKENSIIERCINSSGDYALTYYELIKNYSNFCLVKFVLKTGRTHQIRVHSSYINHPILGDTLYGTASNLINRQALHCNKLCFMHPITKKELKLNAPIPLDMYCLIDLS